MSNIRVERIRFETDASGDASVTSPKIDGVIVQMRYVPDGASPLDTGADITVTGEVTGLVIMNESNIGTSAFNRVPSQPGHLVDGTETAFDYPYVTNEKFTCVVAQGGASKIGELFVWLA